MLGSNIFSGGCYLCPRKPKGRVHCPDPPSVGLVPPLLSSVLTHLHLSLSSWMLSLQRASSPEAILFPDDLHPSLADAEVKCLLISMPLKQLQGFPLGQLRMSFDLHHSSISILCLLVVCFSLPQVLVLKEVHLQPLVPGEVWENTQSDRILVRSTSLVVKEK